MDKIGILGSSISIWNLEETIQKILEMSSSKKKGYVCISNVHTVVTGVFDRQYRNVTNQAALATADGKPLVWASKILSGPTIHGRACGPDLMEELLQKKGVRHFFFGSSSKVLKKLEHTIREKYPNVEIAGCYAPPMRELKTTKEPLSEEEKTELQIIDQSRPDIVWVGLGAPKQEYWMARARDLLQAPVLVGVGAGFDFLSGNKTRAPQWMQSAGLEWFYRLSQEPRRLFLRYFKTNPVFLIGVLIQFLIQRVRFK